MRRVIALVSALILFFLIQLHGADTQAVVSTCPTLVRDAIQRVEQICSGTGRNQICYGHSAMTAEFRPEITDLLLSMPGDVTEIYNLNRVQLFPLDIESEEWGLALLRVQANLPDTLPGQNVLFLLFGDVELTPEPSLQLASTHSNISTPPVSAFRLRSGVGSPACDTAPPDGLLIQTPHGVGRVELTINGVDVNLGSTVYFTAQESGYLTVNTLEGSALVSTEDGESLALAGSQVQVPLNENLQPAAPPMLPQPYRVEGLEYLPLAALERPVEVHPPLTEEEIEVVRQAVLDGEAQALLPETTPEATDQPRPDCPGESCAARTPNAPPVNPGQGGENPGGGAPPDNPGQGGSPPGQGGSNPGQGGAPPANPGQGGENPGQGGGGAPPANPGQGGGSPPANPGGGSPPDNPGQGGGGAPPANPGGGSPPDNPGQGGGSPPANPGGGSPPDNPGQGGGGGNPGQGGGNPGQGGGNPQASPTSTG